MHVNRDTPEEAKAIADLKAELNNPDRKLTALELWNQLSEDLLLANQYAKMTRSGSMPVKLHYERIRKGIEAIKHFEVTKHRVIVDAIIYRLQGLEIEHNQTSVIRFVRRMKIRAQIEATKTVLQIVVNTPPPEGARIQPANEENPGGPRIKAAYDYKPNPK